MSTTLTIGISAYNEAPNIGRLLKDIEVQQFPTEVVVKQVLVVSDGSSDQTVDVALSSPLKNLKVLEDGKRLGLAARLNQIFQQSKTDIVIILNADIRLVGTHCLYSLLKPVLDQGADLTSCPIEAHYPHTIVEAALTASMNIKNEIFDSYLDGDNVYTCHGPARAFSKKLYSKLRFPHSVGEDAYSYLYAKKHGYQYAYTQATRVKYRLPATFVDHQKQSHRFIQSKKQFINEFGTEFVRQAYELPRHMMLGKTAKYFFKSPMSVLLYACCTLGVLLTGIGSKPVPSAWTIASSSKK